MNALAFLAGLTLLASAPAVLADDPPPVVKQETFGDYACGPCAFFNAMAAGGAAERSAVKLIAGDDDLARVRTLLAEQGRQPSLSYPGKPRYEAARGITPADLLSFARAAFQSLGLRGVDGGFLDRGRDEWPDGQLRRIHGLFRRSLDEGMPPLLFLRSFAGTQAEGSTKERELWTWRGVGSHWVAVVSVPPEIAPDARGFLFRYADSASGKVREGYLSAEGFRGFTAAKGDAPDVLGTVDRAYLVATVPDLPLRTQEVPQHLRTFITANYGIYRR